MKEFAMEPDIEAFESSEAYDVLIKAAGSKKLKRSYEDGFHVNCLVTQSDS